MTSPVCVSSVSTHDDDTRSSWPAPWIYQSHRPFRGLFKTYIICFDWNSSAFVIEGGYGIIASVCLFVCLSVHEHNYIKRLQAIFTKPRRIIEYCHGKNPLNSGINPTQHGWMATILDFRCNILHITYFHRFSPGGALVLYITHTHHMQYGGAT